MGTATEKSDWRAKGGALLLALVLALTYLLPPAAYAAEVTMTHTEQMEYADITVSVAGAPDEDALSDEIKETAATPTATVLNIPDGRLRQMIFEQALSKRPDPITEGTHTLAPGSPQRWQYYCIYDADLPALEAATELDIRGGMGMTEKDARKITNLAGLEYLTGLEKLNISYQMYLKALDLSENTKLKELICTGTIGLGGELDVTKNPALELLICQSMNLQTLDVTQNPELRTLNIGYNQLSELDLSAQTKLTYLGIFNNQLSSINLRDNPNLGYLSAAENRLEQLDVSQNQKLGTIDCSSNLIQALNVTGLTYLGELKCGNNQIKVLDVSTNQKLNKLYCNNNRLTSLDVSETVVNTLYLNTQTAGPIQYVEQADGSYTVNLNQIKNGMKDAGFDPAKVVLTGSEAGSTIDSAVQSGSIVTFPAGEEPTTLIYKYDIGQKAAQPAVYMEDVVLTLERGTETPVVTYTVTFKDWDGTPIGNAQHVEHGAAAAAPNAPSRDGYTFTGWDVEFDNVTSDLTVTAQYTQDPPPVVTHKVTFQDWDGRELSVQNVVDGQSAAAPAAPSRTGYTFAGWDKPFGSIMADLTVTAQYQMNGGGTDPDPKPIVKYTVTFQDWNGKVLKRQTVSGGQSATPPATPSREGHAFSGWDGRFDNVTSDLTVTAQYKARHTVTFLDWNGIQLNTQAVEEGQSAAAPENPTRDGYTFIGWDKTFDNVTSDLTVTAQYKAQYTVTFLDWNGIQLNTQAVEEGQSAAAPENPTRDGYTFIGWDKPFIDVTSDLTVTAQYRNSSESDSGSGTRPTPRPTPRPIPTPIPTPEPRPTLPPISVPTPVPTPTPMPVPDGTLDATDDLTTPEVERQPAAEAAHPSGGTTEVAPDAERDLQLNVNITNDNPSIIGSILDWFNNVVKPFYGVAEGKICILHWLLLLIGAVCGAMWLVLRRKHKRELTELQNALDVARETAQRNGERKGDA